MKIARNERLSKMLELFDVVPTWKAIKDCWDCAGSGLYLGLPCPCRLRIKRRKN